VTATCGDGYVGPGEVCDDGNVIDDDGCSNVCAVTGCGDGIVQVGEACDDANAKDTDACLTTCVAASCGDSHVWAGNEACDDGNMEDSDACLMTCLVATCGDGFVWLNQEACDDGNLMDGDGCESDCTLDLGPGCGLEVWSAPHDFGSRVEAMAGGDVLIAGTASVPNQLDPCGTDPSEADPQLTARFGRLDGLDGSTKWLEDYKSPEQCADGGIGIAGISDGRAFAIDQVWMGDHDEFSRIYILQYDVDGTLLTENLYSQAFKWADDVMVGANDRVFFGGDSHYDGFVAEVDLDFGDALWSTAGLWDIELHEMEALDVFDNGEFAVIAYDGRVARITQNQQAIWSTLPGIGPQGNMIDVGGPFETIAAVRTQDVVDIFDANGNPQWQTPGSAAVVDPNGDVYVIVDDALEKRAGADGALLCSTALPMPGRWLAIDELGAPIVLDDQAITKYAP
jgi:cysteine-rich repeat protein